MAKLSGILLDALRDIAEEMIRYAEELNENYGEIVIDVRYQPPDPLKRENRNLECSYSISSCRIADDRHEFLLNYVRNTHAEALRGRKPCVMSWASSKIAFNRQVLCYDGGRYSIAVGVLFGDSKHNHMICKQYIEQIEMLRIK